MRYRAVVMGASMGGMEALGKILSDLPEKFHVPILIVQHLSPNSDSFLASYLDRVSQLKVKEADEKEAVCPGNVYIAPPNYHLLVEKDEVLSLTVESRVNYARPSIDVLFESAAEVYKEKLIGVILTGANSDGSHGLKCVKELGGLTIVQDPKSAEASMMPNSAIACTKIDFILSPEQIGPKISELIGEKQNGEQRR